MKILITNDDGIDSIGLKSLAEVFSDEFETFIIAPEKQRSALGHSITTHKPLRLNEVEIGIKNVKTYSTNGTTADCVILAKDILIKKLDFVISGINELPNVGDDITYSGTISGSMEGVINGIPSISVSILYFKENLKKASIFSKEIVKYLLKNPLKKGTFLNINFPGEGKIKGVKITKIGHVWYRNRTIERKDPLGRPYYWIIGEPVWEGDEKTDTWAVKNGFVSITPLHIDLLNYEIYDELLKKEEIFNEILLKI
ncbi:MAG: 5'/3'-nucleotidase SurE [Caldisericia bacterium]